MSGKFDRKLVVSGALERPFVGGNDFFDDIEGVACGSRLALG
jgi:hypothetical protein